MRPHPTDSKKIWLFVNFPLGRAEATNLGISLELLFLEPGKAPEEFDHVAVRTVVVMNLDEDPTPEGACGKCEARLTSALDELNETRLKQVQKERQATAEEIWRQGVEAYCKTWRKRGAG